MLGTLDEASLPLLETALINVQRPRRIISVDDLNAERRDSTLLELSFLTKISDYVQQEYKIEHEIPFSVVDDSMVNGMCVLHRDRHYICLTSSLFELDDFYIRLSATRSFRDYFKYGRLNGKRGIHVNDETSEVSSAVLATAKPTYLPQRIIDASSVMARLARAYLLLHEFAHAKNGHLHLRSAHGFLPAIDERVSTMQDALDNIITLQTLEMDADSLAYMSLVQIILLKRQWIDESSQFSILQLWGLLQFSIHTLFRIFDRRPFDKDNIWSKSHPPGYVRTSIMCSTQLSHPRFWGGLPVEDITGVLIDARFAVEGAIREKTGLWPDLNWMMRYATTPWPSSHSRRLLQRWALIRNELEPYVLGGGLAPAQEDPA